MQNHSNRQGEGPNTPRKQQGFAMLFRTGLLISKSLLRFHYWHLDMHAGSGWNPNANCPGSPVVFLEEARKVGRSFRALFCDNDPATVAQLRKRLAFAIEEFDDAAISILCEDNRDALSYFAEWIASESESPAKAFGSILLDPNGFKKEDVPLEHLRIFFAVHERIDLILNVNVSLFARVRGCKGNPNTPGFDDWPDPVDVFGLESLKRFWLVRNPQRGGNGDRFVIFVGRNTTAGMTRFEEFYPLHSEQGQAIVRHLVRVQPDQRYFPGIEDGTL